MYNGITMALTNAERQKRWIEKNRALHNWIRRKKNLNGKAVLSGTDQDRTEPENKVPATSTPQLSKIDQLRQLIATVSTEPVVPVMKSLVFRNDHGAVISEKQWNDLQDRKRKAKQGGYVIDDYSQ